MEEGWITPDIYLGPDPSIEERDYGADGPRVALCECASELRRLIMGNSQLAIKQFMGVIACKKDAMQVELARHKEFTKKLNSVRYLHVVRLHDSAADAMATKALEAMAGRVVLSIERKAELRALDKFPKMLYTSQNSADIDVNSADAAGNSADANGNSAKSAEEPRVTATTLRVPDANDIDPLVIQAERRQRISKAHDEELRWADLKGEFAQLSHRRTHNAGMVADEYVLSEDGLQYRQDKVRRSD
ncbi:unnamed protein product [Phytophthora fragariaefolia]|uniref:Unnamed protein product n=1 Tax=Phytophthora fragariaefolia TaxID=1490495 RepID=A0A9W6TJS0_9STRA|nr:unnamed protein product [Phytophthora fragariaefolia]